MIFALCLSACSAPEVRVETRLVAAEIPAQLLEPVSVPDRPVETLADVGLVLADHVEALDKANGQIVSIRSILKGIN